MLVYSVIRGIMGLIGLFSKPEISLVQKGEIGPAPHYHHSSVYPGAFFCHFGLRSFVFIYPVAGVVREGGKIGKLLVITNFLQANQAGLQVFYHCEVGFLPACP